MTSMKPDVIVDIKTCARCELDHQQLRFKPFVNPPAGYHYWSPCPTNGDPIMLEIVAENEKVAPDPKPES